MSMRYFVLAIPVLLAAGCARQPNGGRNVEVTWGLDTITAAHENPENVVLPILKCNLEGFIEDVSEYRAWAVKRRDPTGRIIATVPSAGTYYPAFIFYDGAGHERVGVWIDGQEAGMAVANVDDNRQKLYYLSEPRAFRGGEKIELRATNADGMYRTEDLLLLKQKPEAREFQHAIRDVAVRPGANSATVTWVTNWPAACTVETSGPSVKEDTPFNNHRVQLSGLESGREYRYRVVTQGRDGKTVASEWQNFRTNPPPEPAGKAQKERVPLKIEGGRLLVTAGVPFAQGVLGSDAHLRLLDGKGAEIPLQTRVLGRWPDGSVKWALLDFESSQPGATLEYGAQVGRAKTESMLKLTEDARAVTIDTGKIRFAISKQHFGLLDSVSLEGELVAGEPGVFSLTGPDGTVYTSAAAPDEVVIEDRGPVRASVRVSGQHESAAGGKMFAYTVRVHAWAGQPYVRVQHTFGNNNGASDFTSIKNLTLNLPLSGAGKRWAMANRSGTLKADAPVRLKQHRDDRFVVEPNITKGRRAAGWAEWSDGQRVVTLAVRDLWQNYPKDLAVKADGFELGLCPPLKPDEYDDAKGTIDEHRIYYYLQGGVYKLRQGVSKTHDFWLEFGKNSTASIRAEQRVRMAAAPAEWYAQSKAFGELSTPEPAGILKQYDGAFVRSFAGYMKGREALRSYGMLNFGDWWGERIINWGNSEYDTQHAFLLQFARTGDWNYFRAAEEMEWHNRDIDTIQHHTDKMMVGAMYGHAIGHTGSYYEERPTGGAPKGGFRAGSPRSHFAVDHTFVEGHFDYYFLTGDRRSLETGVATSNRYNSYFTRNYDFNNCRQPGWHLILAMAAYRATNDPFHLNAAKMITERVLERQTPDGGWKRQMVPGHCYCTPRHEGNAGFMVGVLLTGLRHYYEATGDERVANSIVKGAHFLIKDMWVPEARGFRYTSCPKSQMGAWSNFLLFDGIVFAHRRTGEDDLRDVLVSGTGPALETMVATGDKGASAWGKGFSQYTRVVPHFIDHLATLKVQPAPGRTSN